MRRELLFSTKTSRLLDRLLFSKMESQRDLLVLENGEFLIEGRDDEVILKLVRARHSCSSRCFGVSGLCKECSIGIPEPENWVSYISMLQRCAGQLSMLVKH